MFRLHDIEHVIDIDQDLLFVQLQELFDECLVFVQIKVGFNFVVVGNLKDTLDVSWLLDSHKQLKDLLLFDRDVFVTCQEILYEKIKELKWKSRELTHHHGLMTLRVDRGCGEGNKCQDENRSSSHVCLLEA